MRIYVCWSKYICVCVVTIFCLFRSEKEEKKVSDEIKKDICNFGSGCARYCICAIPGQVPCPYYVKLPVHMTGKYRRENKLIPPKGLYRY